jgi:hypothetical protein
MPAVIKKSPRAPSITLQDALERALKAYDRERLHEAPTDIVAQNIGYKNANSGTALSAIASLRYFGLLTRPRNGFLAVAKEVEAYRFSPDEKQKRQLLMGFLMAPPLYMELLQKYSSGLPSDATLKYELIQRGFIPAAAETTVAAFRHSVHFASYYDEKRSSEGPQIDGNEDDDEHEQPAIVENEYEVNGQNSSATMKSELPSYSGGMDNIPVRLSGGRKACLIIPSPFYKADKARLKAHIELILAEDEEDEIDE